MENILWIILLLFICQHSVDAQSKREVIVGGIFHGDDDISQLAFKTAIDEVNYKSSQFTVKGFMFNISRNDGFEAQRIVCDLSAKGVDAIFGPSSPETTGIVASIAEKFEIPHFIFHWATKPMHWKRSPERSMTLNLYPEADFLAESFSSVLMDFDWKSYTIVYEKKENFIRLKDILQIQSPEKIDSNVEVQQLHGDLGIMLKKIPKNGNIVLDISVEKIVPFLVEAEKVEMLTEYTNYFITNLDAHTLDLSPIGTIGSNITCLRLVNPYNDITDQALQRWQYSNFHLNMTTKQIPSEAALVNDAVQGFFSALHSKSEGNPKIPRNKNSCNNPQRPKTNFGSELISFIKSENYEGMTGKVGFNNGGDDKFGSRMQFSLDILELSNREFKKIGFWNTTEKLNYFREDKADADQQILEKIQDKLFKIVVKIGKPFCIETEYIDENNVTQTKYEGYVIDLIDKLKENLNFTYKIEVVPDQQYGTFDKKTKKWNGLVQHLLERKADMAVADISITYERKTAVDFSSPFMNLGIGILYVKPPKKDSHLFSFLEPFTVEVWAWTAVAYISVSFSVFVLSRINKDDWESTNPLSEQTEEIESIWNILNCVWLAMASIMGQGCDILPKGSSTRIITGTWYFFALIMLASYTANLAAFLTNERKAGSINGAEDLVSQSKVQYGAVKDGSTMKFFKHSNFSIYQQMWAAMENNGDSVHTMSNEEGVSRVLNGKGGYAFLMESVPMEYQRIQNCSLEQVGELLDSKGYGIALPMNSPYRTTINKQLLTLQESGELIKIKDKWWNSTLKCEKDEDHADLDMANVGGVFVLLLVGFVTAIVVALLEMFDSITKIAIEEKISHWTALKREFAFVFTFFIVTKPVHYDDEDESECKSRKSSIAKRSTSSRRESASKATRKSSLNLSEDKNSQKLVDIQ